MNPLQSKNLHQQAIKMKNMARMKHDGGRAWIKDSQLHDAIRGENDGVLQGRRVSAKTKQLTD